MEQYNLIENDTRTEKKTNGFALVKSSYREPLKNLVKKVFAFICYGPGVFGFLWLIGRIFKR